MQYVISDHGKQKGTGRQSSVESIVPTSSPF